MPHEAWRHYMAWDVIYEAGDWTVCPTKCMVIPDGEKDQVGAPVLKLLREHLNLSQERFARLIGCSAKKISRGENGNPILWTTSEAKALDELMRKYFGKTIQDLPDDLSSFEHELPFLGNSNKT